MTLKNSFWVSLRENNRRRIWLWIISALFWFFYYPVLMAMLMSSRKGSNMIYGYTGEEARSMLLSAAEGLLSFHNDFTTFCVAAVAIVCAVQGFSYLYSRKKVDMYHSLPVKKSSRFAVIFTNGVLIYLIPYTVGLLLALAVAGINGGIDNANLQMALVSWLMNLVLFLGFYGMALIAVMLTGKLLITLFATGVLLVYELVLIVIPHQYQREFFDYYSHYTEIVEPYLHPLSWMGRAAAEAGDNRETVLSSFVSEWPFLLAGLLLVAVFCAIAYFCYKIRPAEAAGKAMAFGKTKPVVKVLLVVPFALEAVMLVRDVVGDGDTTVFAVFGMAVAVILGSCIIEVIYEADIRAAFRKKGQILISGAFAAAVYCIYCFDLTGYDAWVPEQGRLEDAVFLFPYDGHLPTPVNENLIYQDRVSFYLERPGVKDVEAICELSSKKGDYEGAYEDAHEDVMWCHVAYRMKNGRTVWRYIPIGEGERELLNRIMGSRESKEALYPLYDDEYYQMLLQHKVTELTFSNGFRVENLPTEDFDGLRRAWKADMEGLDYDTLQDEFKAGVVHVALEGQSNNATQGLFVYPSFTNTLAFLEGKGIYTEGFLRPEDIESISVTNYHYEIIEEKRALAEEYAGKPWHQLEEEFSVSRTFTGEGEIRDLLEAIYPINLDTSWKGEELASGYYVSIKYKEGVADSESHRGTHEAHLIAERVPEWLEKATAYK